MFITFIIEKFKNKQITFSDLFENPQTIAEITRNEKQITIETKPPKNAPAIIEFYKQTLLRLTITLPELMEYTPETIKQSYTTYRIPKKSGGFRTINAPNERLKMIQRHVLNTLQSFNTLMHNSAYAYIKGRSAYDAQTKHKNNNSNWFLHIDLKDFFGSCTQTFVYEQISKVYPFYLLKLDENCDKIIKQIVNIACLDGVLPQGNPLAPYFTNLLMVPFDYQLDKLTPIYTRYSDDMLFSARTKLDVPKILTCINEIFKDTPLKINPEKTRLGSKNGNNWNLGLMLNKENNITVGHKAKRIYKTKIDQFLYDPESYSIADIQKLAGITSYYKHIEPQYFSYIIDKYSEKHNKDLLTLLKT